MTDRDRRIVDNLAIARVVAKRIYRRFGRLAELEDFEQQAMLGLIDASDRFDPDAGAKFSTWAFRVCHQRCLTLIQTDVARAAKGRVMRKLGEHDVHVVDQRAPRPDQIAQANEEIGGAPRSIAAAMARLTDRQRQILEYRYKGETLRRIGRRLGVTRQRIRQIELKATARVRELMAPAAAAAAA